MDGRVVHRQDAAALAQGVAVCISVHDRPAEEGGETHIAD